MDLRHLVLALLALLSACASAPSPAGEDAHGDHHHPVEAAAPTGGAGAAAAGGDPRAGPALPADGAGAAERLAASPRHGEWAMVAVPGHDSVRVWIVYPERADPAPVVVVVHEIFGLSHWIRGVADQLAAEGFIGVAPDLLTSRGIPVGADGAPDAEAARVAIRSLGQDEIHAGIAAAARHAMALPAALPRYAVIGFCWGGTEAFAHAARSPGPAAAVPFYGTSPASAVLERIGVPVLGLYGENDARVNVTIAQADSVLRARGRRFEQRVFPGAGHGFLRAQQGMEGANLAATREAWPLTVTFLRETLGDTAPRR
jgi:carboxymethylenebutenolidase